MLALRSINYELCVEPLGIPYDTTSPPQDSKSEKVYHFVIKSGKVSSQCQCVVRGVHRRAEPRP